MDKSTKAELIRANYSKTHEVTAPSGNVFKVRKPGFMAMFARGILPQRMFALAMKLQDSTNHAKVVEQNPKDLMEIMYAYIVEACVEPKLVLKPEDVTPESLCVTELPDEDAMFLFSVSMGLMNQGGEQGAKPLDSFREGPRSPLD